LDKRPVGHAGSRRLGAPCPDETRSSLKPASDWVSLGIALFLGSALLGLRNRPMEKDHRKDVAGLGCRVTGIPAAHRRDDVIVGFDLPLSTKRIESTGPRRRPSVDPEHQGACAAVIVRVISRRHMAAVVNAASRGFRRRTTDA
jgi:hypothetical protein